MVSITDTPVQAFEEALLLFGGESINRGCWLLKADSDEARL